VVNQATVDSVNAHCVSSHSFCPNDPGQVEQVTVNIFHLSLSTNPSTLVGEAGQTSVGTVSVDATPAISLNVGLSGGNVPVSVPTKVTISANSTSATFNITAGIMVSQPTSGNITATYSDTASASMTVEPFQITLSVPSVISTNEKATGTVTLAPPPPGGGTVGLKASPGNFSMPNSVSIAAGQSSGSFTFTGLNVTEPEANTITATYGASTTANVTVTPPNGPCPCDGAAGYPINLATGNVWITQTDYSLPGLGVGLGINRTWNSLWRGNNGKLPDAGMFGDSWRSTYEEALTVVDTTNIKYWRPNGDSWWFRWSNPNNAYYVLAPQNQHATLTFNSTTLLFTLTFSDGTQRIFNNAGALTALIDRNGNQTTITYDSSNRISQVTDAAARSITFTYNDPHNPAQATGVQDSTGTIATYTYDTLTRLLQVTYADGSFLTFSYDPSYTYPIDSVKDKLGNIVEAHTYDSSHRGLTSQRANSVDSVTVAYSTGSTQLTDSLGNVTTYTLGYAGAVPVLSSVSGPTCHTCQAQGSSSSTYDQFGNQLTS
jgi:YD repeat-containing protein